MSEKDMLAVRGEVKVQSAVGAKQLCFSHGSAGVDSDAVALIKQ